MDTTATVEANSSLANVLRLIVCLGNPGEDYAETRHNTGFQVGDALLTHFPTAVLASWQPSRGLLYEAQYLGQPFWVLKPMTYMNSSGDAVADVTRHFGFSPSQVLVVSDCLDLPLGRLRMRPGGSDGGQRGLRSILCELGTTAVPRLRVGIGRPQSSECDIVSYVLACWTSAEKALLKHVKAQAVRGLMTVLAEGLEAGMRECNAWTADNNNAEVQEEYE